MNIEIPVSYKNLDFILTVTNYKYYPADPGSRLDPPTPEEIEVLDGSIELDGEVNDFVDITSEEMDVIMQMTNDNNSLFDDVVEECFEVVEQALLEHETDLRAYYASECYDEYSLLED